MLTRVLVAGAAILGTSAAVHAGNAITVPAADAVPGVAVAGLNGAVYQDGIASILTGNPTSEIPAIRAAAAGSPSATYTATMLNYTGGDTTATNTFLGADATGTALADTATLRTSVFDAAGVVTITTPGTYTFGINNSDDASYIFVDGQQVAATPGSHGGQADSGTADFSVAGNYPIEVLYVNQDYNGSTGGASFQYNSTFSDNGVTHTELGHVVPEPASLSVIGFAAAGLLARRRRKA